MILGAQTRTDGMVGVGKATAQTPGDSCCQQDLQLEMSVGSDGLVKQVSTTFRQQNANSPAAEGAYTWSVTYSQLGMAARSTHALSVRTHAPARARDAQPDAAPANGLVTSTPERQGRR
jgi:hypothetical protein